jgi:hypothetical protein
VYRERVVAERHAGDQAGAELVVGLAGHVAVAALLLHEEIGYRVEVVAVDEYAQWDSLAWISTQGKSTNTFAG